MGDLGVSSKVVEAGRVKHIGSQRSLENYRDLVIVLLQKELKVRYTNKFLGYLWSIANPLSSAFIYYIAFALILEIREPDYPLVLITGLFPWQWFSNSINSSSNLFLGKGSIIKKVSFPRNIIPFCWVLNHMIHFIVSVPVIILFLFLFNQAPNLTWVYGFPLLLIIQLCMVYGGALAVSSINLFFRDLERLIGIVIHFLFFLTPVLYTVDRYPAEYRNLLIAINPPAALMVNWRSLFLDGTLNPLYVLISMGYAVLFLLIGYVIYRKLSWKFAELL